MHWKDNNLTPSDIKLSNAILSPNFEIATKGNS